ncbi:DUF3857 domain-containing transglutaminase family protein [Paraburkholderia guartelaensis]|nr:DUF3857 domain-containing protein [Paraburkholderia guartelaensis]
MQRFSQYAVPYNADLQKLAIDDAQTVHEDGKVVHADLHAAVFDRPAPTTVTAPQFSAEHYRIVAFPATTRGDTLRLHYTLTDLDTLYRGKFTEIANLAPTEDVEDAQETLETPRDMPVRVEANGMQAVSDTTTDSRRIRVYRYRTPASGPLAEQASAVSTLDSGPYFVATNFTSYADVARAFEAGIAPQSQPTAAIRAQADRITGDVADRRQQAMLIYEWVSRNIRYLAAYVGTGPVVPHSADSVLRDGYGDCKDHAALFIALLRAKGIRADSVLVNLGNSYRLPDAPVWYVFNHAIVWLPEFALFADTTNGFAPFGILSFAASDKPALDTATGEMLHTPPQNATNSASSINYTIKVREDGDADLAGTITLVGQIGIAPRRQLTQNTRQRIGYELLRQSGLTGTIDVLTGDANGLNAPVGLSVQGTVNGLAIMPGPAALAVPIMPNYGSIRAFAEYVLRQAGEPLNGPCGASALREHFRVELPAGAKIIAMPPDLSRTNGALAYTATYRRDGQTVDIDRTLIRDFHTNVCSGEMLKQWTPIAREISTDLKRQILYR